MGLEGVLNECAAVPSKWFLYILYTVTVVPYSQMWLDVQQR